MENHIKRKINIAVAGMVISALCTVLTCVFSSDANNNPRLVISTSATELNKTDSGAADSFYSFSDGDDIVLSEEKQCISKDSIEKLSLQPEIERRQNKSDDFGTENAPEDREVFNRFSKMRLLNLSAYQTAASNTQSYGACKASNREPKLSAHRNVSAYAEKETGNCGVNQILSIIKKINVLTSDDVTKLYGRFLS